MHTLNEKRSGLSIRIDRRIEKEGHLSAKQGVAEQFQESAAPIAESRSGLSRLVDARVAATKRR